MNPVIFAEHRAEDFLTPIARTCGADGRCTARVETHRIIGKIYYSQTSKMALQVWELSREGIWKSYSIGFAPLQEPTRLKATSSNPNPGYQYTHWKLLESARFASLPTPTP
jgi:hypothetical protein